jgi:hypothetical protein
VPEGDDDRAPTNSLDAIAVSVFVRYETVRKQRRMAFKIVLCTDQEMIRARNAIDVREEYFLVKDELLLRILRAFAHYSRSLHATGNA